MNKPETVPMTPLRFRLDETLLVKAGKLNASRYNKWLFCFALILALILTGFYAWEQSQQGVEGILMMAVLILMGGTLGYWSLIAVSRIILLPIQVRKNLRQQKGLTDEMQLSWTDDEFCYATGKSQTLMPFRDLHGFRASRDVILLYRSDLIYHVVPVAAFGPSSLHDAFNQRLVEEGVRRL